MEKFSEFLTRRREKLGWSKSDLARMAGVATGNISRYENNDELPDPPNAIKLAAALRVSPVQVLHLAGHEGFAETLSQYLSDEPVWREPSLEDVIPDREERKWVRKLLAVLREPGKDSEAIKSVLDRFAEKSTDTAHRRHQ